MTNISSAPAHPASAAQSKAASGVQRFRRRIAPASTPEADLAASSVVNVQVWMDQALWRPAGLWAFVAGLLATGGLRLLGDLNWQALALLALLVDPLWGGIWRLAGGRQALLTLPRLAGEGKLSLPYLQSGSPAARLLEGDHTDVWPAAVRIGAPAVLVALAVAALLGVYALGLTLAVVVLAALGWTLRHSFGNAAPLPYSIVAIGLPWLLTVQQVQQQVQQNSDGVAWLPQLLLAGLWTIHQWGGLRNVERSSGQADWLGLAAMGAAQIGLCVLLIAIQAPLWIAPLAVLLLPVWLLAYQQQPLRRLRVLWLAAMLVSAVALGQTVGV